MSVQVTFNGKTYNLPTSNDVDWGAALTAFLQAVAANASTAGKTETLSGKTINGSNNTLSNIPNSATTATDANTASAIVARDASGSFAAGRGSFDTLLVTGTASAGTLKGTLLQVSGDNPIVLPSGDSSGTPGNATINKPCGRSAIAGGASSVTITNSAVKSGSLVFAVIQQTSADATLTRIERIRVAAGSFQVYGNAAATAAVSFSWFVITPS